MSATTKWNERYRSSTPDFAPSVLVTDAARSLQPGLALDLACGTGGNALWLAEQGWQVTAVDVSAVAIDLLRQEAVRRRLDIKAFAADLEEDGFAFNANAWDLIVLSKYFQPDLIEPVKQAVALGGFVITSALLQEPDQTNSSFRVQRGELRGSFSDWEILLDREPETIGSHSLAEIVATKPR